MDHGLRRIELSEMCLNSDLAEITPIMQITILSRIASR